MMTYRIQKTIISKYLLLADKETINENEVFNLLDSIEKLYKDGVLIQSDIYRQKLLLIKNSLASNLEVIKRKRVDKEIKFDSNSDFINILRSDVDNVEYGKTELSDIVKIEPVLQTEISFENTKLVIENLVISKRKLTAERDLEKFIAEQLRFVFGKERVHQQYSVGGFYH
jgi:hypothetical protein